MLTLYYRPTCVFSQRVLGEAEEMGISFNLKDVTDAVLLTEMIEKGGEDSIPFLVDEDRGVHMYESNDIISYLQTHYPNGNSSKTFGGLRIHDSEEICDTCQ